ncbi:acyl-CoA dehydrogenase family protein [Thiomonas sp. FB-Cd]|uniref:acyl-CoA dehydrogenase family protein n=1 Tax=Thiomonas sp. FB-Cd TaxID=1158292 RepID=UPI0004DF07D3|nr:acyl-CoA dehydrogenase [Thiomonas sp. FB-Cd]
MQWQATDEQRQLADALQRFIQRDYPFEQRRALSAGSGFSAHAWGLLAQLGITALLVPETHGGLGASAQDGLHAVQVLAPALPLEPVVASSLLATHLLGMAAGPVAHQWLPRMAEGKAIATPAHFEVETGFATEQPHTRADRTGLGYALSGAKTLVLQAPFADVLLVSARTPDDTVAWFAVERDRAGVSVQDYPLLDGQRAADVQFDAVQLPPEARLGHAGQGAAMRDGLRDLWLAALCAEAVGLLQATLDATVAYLNTRQQFGQPIGRFQALQHRAVDMWMEVEQARSMALLAAGLASHQDVGVRAQVLTASKARVGQACRFVSQQAVQLHGGMGMTDEMQVSHWFKRLTTIELWLGDSDAQLQRFARGARAA